MFIDQVEITVQSGKGGDGSVHFRKEKYVSRGGPDGGDGGRGGDVILVVNRHQNTLFAFRSKKIFTADVGGNGARSNRTGKSADDLEIEVPPGTVVYDNQSGSVIGDLVEVGQRLVVCRGGRGGRGNARFATARNQAPRIGERGEPGEERELRLELKLIADVGIVGVPNAGKSTFLSVVTNAKPKIANYPFTTLHPNLGVASLDEDNSLVLADIPGLIEGAHMGVGLGHDFLRHVQRTRVLIHLLDGLSDDPVADFAQFNSELALFDDALGEKAQVVALNKADLPSVLERWPDVEADLKKHGVKPMLISAVSRENVRKLLYQAAELVAALPEPEPVVEMPVYRPETDPEEFSVKKTEEGWRVVGASIERAAAMTYWEYDQSVRRFQRILEALGIDKALRDEGIKQGDTVLIGKYELEWED